MPPLRPHRALLPAVLSIAAVLGLSSCSNGTSTTSNATESIAATGQVKHVFIITLENKNYAQTFGSTTAAPYLATTLANQGALLQGYYGTGHVSLDNYVSMVSGQLGTPQTTSDCSTYADFNQTEPGLTTAGQAIGTGCVYPVGVKTIADQLNTAGLTWKGYMEDMGNDPTREAATCGRPTLNTADLTQVAEAPNASVPLGDNYASRHDPFVYFHSIVDNATYCNQHVVNYSALAADLASVSTTANLTFITPNLCDDGHDAPCANGAAGGLASINTWLQTAVPMILNSPAYKQDGLLIINFDEGNYTAGVVNGSYVLTFPGVPCCGEVLGPNLPAYPQTISAPGYTLTYAGYGGDNTGAVLLSPFITPGTVSTTPYNHFSMLRTIEDIFGLTHLGYAATAGLQPMGTDVFTNIH
jgi:hypothetical protein